MIRTRYKYANIIFVCLHGLLGQQVKQARIFWIMVIRGAGLLFKVCLGGRCGSFFFLGIIILKHTPHFLKAKNTCFLVRGVVAFWKKQPHLPPKHPLSRSTQVSLSIWNYINYIVLIVSLRVKQYYFVS